MIFVIGNCFWVYVMRIVKNRQYVLPEKIYYVIINSERMTSMIQFFDFTGIENSQSTIKESWSEFRNILASGKCKYNETDKAKSYEFLKVFDDLFQNGGKKHFETTVSNLAHKRIGRGQRLKNDELVTYERFIPKSEFIKEDNRFSPPGDEWLYLAVGDSIIDVSKKEINIQKGERFGFCDFDFCQNAMSRKIVDLTIADGLQQDEINNKLENQAKTVAIQLKNESLKTGIIPPKNANKGSIVGGIKKWMIYTYAKLLSEQIFVPVQNSNKRFEYTPFQTLAQYFLSLGYSGIIYKSTVYAGGKNLVLFDKNFAVPTGDIIDIIV